MPVKNLSPSPVFYGANVNPHQSPQEFYTCESKFKQGKKKGAQIFITWILLEHSLHVPTYRRASGLSYSCIYSHTSAPLLLQLPFLRGFKKQPPEIKPFTFRSTMTKIKKPSAFLHHDMNYALQQFKNCFSNLNAAAWLLGFQQRRAAGPVPSLSV